VKGLKDAPEAKSQIAFADVIILNKNRPRFSADVA
jgi:G3E family GTPase